MCALSLGGFKLGLFRWSSALIQSQVALNLRISSCHPVSFTGQSLLVVPLSASFIARTAGVWAAVLAWRHLSLCSWSLICEGKEGPSGAIFLRRRRRTTSIKLSFLKTCYWDCHRAGLWSLHAISTKRDFSTQAPPSYLSRGSVMLTCYESLFTIMYKLLYADCKNANYHTPPFFSNHTPDFGKVRPMYFQFCKWSFKNCLNLVVCFSEFKAHWQTFTAMFSKVLSDLFCFSSWLARIFISNYVFISLFMFWLDDL